MLVRTLVVSITLFALAAPAAAQDAPPAPSAYAYASGTPAASTAAPPARSTYFPPRDRHGRTLTGTRHELQNDRGMWGAGLGLFLAGWVLDVAGTAIFNAVSLDRADAQEQDAMAWSILPLVGPVIQLGIGAPHPALPITSGLLQITGCVLFILGMTTQRDVEIPIYAWGDPHGARTASLGLDIAPTDGGAYATLTLRAM